MYLKAYHKIFTAYLDFWSLAYSEVDVRKYINDALATNTDGKFDFYDTLSRIGGGLELGFTQNRFAEKKMGEIIATGQPILVFKDNEDSNPSPMLVVYKKGNLKGYCFRKHDIQPIEYNNIPSLLEDLHFDASDLTSCITCFPASPNFSKSSTDDYSEEKLTPLARFWKLIRREKREIIYLYIYGIMVALISLSLPLGLQAIISFISGGSLFNSLIILIAFVLVGVIVSGALQVMQITVVEYIQRRIFAKAAFEFAFRIPRIKLSALLNYYPPELMNRFFDIINVQKSFSKIMVTFSSASMQILFGILLLSFYHPFFVFFGLIMILLLVVIFRITGPSGLKTSLKESKYKYKVAEWLEELARTLITFKLAGQTKLPLEKTDYLTGQYLQARKSHFKILIQQFIYLVAFKTIVTGTLLVLGGILVIEGSLNIGQFVAAEIIILLIVSAVEKLISSMENVYDMLTAIEKVGAVTDLPIEDAKGIHASGITSGCGYTVTIRNLSFKFPNADKNSINNLSLVINTGERLCITGPDGSGKTTLLKLISGFHGEYKGEISFNDISLRSLDVITLRNEIGDNLIQEDIFEGTVTENITMGRMDISIKEVIDVARLLKFETYINNLKYGFDTPLMATGKGVPGKIIKKIILARSLVKARKLLLIQDFFHHMPRKEKLEVLEIIANPKQNCTVVFISNDPDVMKICDYTAIMHNGEIINKGPYDQIPAEYAKYFE